MLWLSFPLVWIVYTLIRGAIVNKYPYPFLDPVHGGYGSVAVYCDAILVAMLVVSALVVVLANAAGGGRRRVEPNGPIGQPSALRTARSQSSTEV